MQLRASRFRRFLTKMGRRCRLGRRCRQWGRMERSGRRRARARSRRQSRGPALGMRAHRLCWPKGAWRLPDVFCSTNLDGMEISYAFRGARLGRCCIGVCGYVVEGGGVCQELGFDQLCSWKYWHLCKVSQKH